MPQTPQGAAVPTLLMAMSGLFIVYLFLVYPGTRSDIIIEMEVKRVNIDEDGFHPSKIRSNNELKVRWVNRDDVHHTVTGKNFDVELEPDQSHTHVYREPGTYSYECKYHPGESGKVTITGETNT